MPKSRLKPRRSRRRDRRAATAVEFALVAPILFMLFFAMVEMGRSVMVHQLLVNAAREGARSAAFNTASASEVITQVQDSLALSSVPGATVTVTPSPIVPGSSVTVAVQVPYDDVSWLPIDGFLDGITLDSSCRMQTESPLEAP